MKIGLIDIDYKIRCLALMRLSTFWKQKGAEVHLNQINGMDKVYVSVLFRKNRLTALEYLTHHPDVTIGGYGYNLYSKLPSEVESCAPDYELYSVANVYSRTCKGIGTKEKKLRRAAEIQSSGMGFSSYGCIRACPWCIVPKIQGKFRQGHKIKDLVNPNSDLLFLLDNNFTADPYAAEKLIEIKERNLRLEISQGIDIRLITDHLAYLLQKVRHRGSLHYAWDKIEDEREIMSGIKILSQYTRPRKQMCFILTGFNSSFEAAEYRVRKLSALGISPFLMIYQDPEADIEGPGSDIPFNEWKKLKFYARYINGHIYKAEPDFNKYVQWVNYQTKAPDNNRSLV